MNILELKKKKKVKLRNSLRTLSLSYQYKTEPHEWLYLVLFHRRPMENHGVKALDEHVVSRRHVTKSRKPMLCFQLKFQRKQALHGLVIEHVCEITRRHIYLDALVKVSS